MSTNLLAPMPALLDGAVIDAAVPMPPLDPSHEARLIRRTPNETRATRERWRVRVEASPLSGAWKAAVDLTRGDCCIGVFAFSGGARRGSVLSSGCSQPNLAFISVEGLRTWLQEHFDSEEEDGENVVAVDPSKVADAANLPWLKRLPGLAAGRLRVPGEGCFYMLIGWRRHMTLDKTELRPLRLAMRILAQCAVTHAMAVQRERRMRILEGTLDELGPAFILVNRSSQVFWTNYRAELLLAQRDLLLRNGGNLLACSTPTRTQKLRKAIADLGRPGEDGLCADEYLLLPRGDGEGDLIVLRPVAGRHDLEGNDAVLVLVPRHDASEHAAKLIKVFGLIPSEARLVGALIRSGSSAQAAADIGITEQTAKTYLKRIYAKLGINSQLELGVLIAQLAPPLRGGEAAHCSDHQITTF